MTSNFLSWASDGDEVQSGVRLNEHKGRSFVVARIVMEPGAELNAHAHEEEQFFLVLDGQLRYRVGDEEKVAHGGEAIIMPSNVPHWGRAEGDRPVVFVEVKEKRNSEE